MKVFLTKLKALMQEYNIEYIRVKYNNQYEIDLCIKQKDKQEEVLDYDSSYLTIESIDEYINS